MLSLDSPRWLELKTFCPSPERLPGLVRRWCEASAQDVAGAICHELRDGFLQQFSITDAA